MIHLCNPLSLSLFFPKKLHCVFLSKKTQMVWQESKVLAKYVYVQVYFIDIENSFCFRNNIIKVQKNDQILLNIIRNIGNTELAQTF